MSPQSKYEYFQVVATRYSKASRAEKSRILDEFCEICAIRDRNHAIHKLNHPEKYLHKSKRKRGRKSKYNQPEVLKPLKKIWLKSNLLCSKNLKALLSDWIHSYEESFEPLSEEVKAKLRTISPATIDRILKKLRPHYKKHGLSTTKPGSLLKHHIPIKTDQWDEKRPGFIESDTVAHCGSSTLGPYVLSIDYLDIATTWSEQRAVFGKGERGVVLQTKDVEKSFPFPILGFDSDQGSEFMNWHLYRHFTSREKPVDFTRSRAYKKNDNAHIEQKNWTHIRQWLGYDRFEHPQLVPLLNDLYKTQWRLFHNFFIPSVKLIDKRRTGSKTTKIHDKPKTPYQRIIESSDIPQETKDKLTSQKQQLNPFKLRDAMDEKIKKIFATLRRLNKNKPTHDA